MTGPTASGGYNDVLLYDLNKDGHLDIAGATDSNYHIGIHVWLGDGGTTWTASNTGLPTTNQYFSVSAGDLNKDGNPDLILGTPGWGVDVYLGNGGTSWTKATGTGLPSSATYWSVNVTDLDNDGNLDIVAGQYDAGGLYAYTGNGGSGGTLTFTKESSGLPTSKIYCQIVAGDVDKNGFKDVFGGLCDPNPKGLALWLNNGNSGGALAWVELTGSSLPTAGDYSGAMMADFDNDGDLDLIGGGAGWSAPSNGMKAYKTSISIPIPVADAGQDQTVLVLDNVTLDGTASKMSFGSDPIAGFDWNFTSKPSGSTATLSDESIAKPVFQTDKIGTYTLSLSVKDSGNKWSPVEDTVTITATAWPNKKPTANAGLDKTVKIFTQVQLDGSGSWDDAQITAYNWNITSKPTDSNISLSDETIVNPTFTPDIIGLYKFTLCVKDVNNTWSSSDEIKITVNPAGTGAPMANAGQDFTIELGGNITLDGSASTDDMSITTYDWTVTAEPAGSSIQLQDIKTQVVVPTHQGVYDISLMVKDNDNLWSMSADTMRCVVLPKNLPPVAKIDKPEDESTYLSTDIIDFDGSKSSDPEDNDITIEWTSDLDGQLGTEKTFSRGLSIGTHTISLSVTDDHSQVTVATIEVTVKLDTAPTAALTAEPTVILKNEKVNFDAKASKDLEGTVAEYKFDFGDGTSPVWATTPTTSHVYKSTGTFQATVTVKDNKGQIGNASAAIAIKVGDKPTASLTMDLAYVKVKKPVSLDASASKDTDGSIVSFYFDFGDGTNSGWVNSSKITKTYTKAGQYTVSVKVRDNDEYESANTATVKITVEKPKVANNNLGGSLMVPLVIVLVVVLVAIVVAMMVMKKKKAAAAEAAAQAAVQAPPPPPTAYAGMDQTQQYQQPAYQQPASDQGQYQQQGYYQQPYQQQTYDQGQYQQQGYDQNQYQYPPQ